MFTYRDFEGGTLGLAWTGDLKNAGGVCEKNGVRNAMSKDRLKEGFYDLGARGGIMVGRKSSFL